jgi:hypothetical protein
MSPAIYVLIKESETYKEVPHPGISINYVISPRSLVPTLISSP